MESERNVCPVDEVSFKSEMLSLSGKSIQQSDWQSIKVLQHFQLLACCHLYEEKVQEHDPAPAEPSLSETI